VVTKQLITDFFTEHTITKLAQEEVGKRQYYRPVYSLHKWWARRPGALFRAMILLSTSPDSSLHLFQSDKDNVVSLKSVFFANQHLKDMIIFDPFMGGGTTLVEANRMGAKVIGCDLNPVSYWVVRETLKEIDLKKLQSYFFELERTAGERIKSLYKTQCLQCKNEYGDILYAFWVRYIECPRCDQPVYLFKRYLLNEGIKRTQGISQTNPATAVCPSCHNLNQFRGEDNCVCSNCKTMFHPRDKVFDKGYFSCSHCLSKKMSLINTVRQGRSLKEKLFAIEYYCLHCKDRLYKSPDERDNAKIADIQSKFDAEKEQLIFPKQDIPEGSSSARWIAHNFQRYYQVFSVRQIIAFNYLFSAINQISEEEYRNAFITIFSNSLEYNNMMIPYNYPHRKIHHLFNYHALPLTTTPVENNVWGVSAKGAGTFVNCYRRYAKAKEYCQYPFDKFKDTDGKINTVFSSREKIQGRFVSSFEELKTTDRGVWLHCRDSSNLPFIPDKSVDAVITDPPYFDNIHYSELSNFFYVWLRLFQPNDYFVNAHVSTEQEAIVNAGMDKTEEDYCQLITSVFSECNRVLKDDGLMMFTFHHSKPKAWWTILRAIVDSGLIVVDYFPVTSEYKVNPHLRGKVALDTDLVIVCAKRKSLDDNPQLVLGTVTKQDKRNEGKPKAQFDQHTKQKFNFDTVVTQASKRLTSLYDEQPNTEGGYYFYYIGEILRVGSQSKNVSGEDFEKLFKQSEAFTEKIQADESKKTTKTQEVKYSDLPLFSGILSK